MLLSFRFLNDVAGVNSFEATTSASISQGDTQDLYIQLIDSSLDRGDQGFNPAGRRYMPAVDSTMTCTFSNADTGASTGLDDALSPRINPGSPVSFVRAADQPFEQDASIWRIPILASDPLTGTVNMKLTLVEGSRTLTVASRPGMVLRSN